MNKCPHCLGVSADPGLCKTCKEADWSKGCVNCDHTGFSGGVNSIAAQIPCRSCRLGEYREWEKKVNAGG